MTRKQQVFRRTLTIVLMALSIAGLGIDRPALAFVGIELDPTPFQPAPPERWVVAPNRGYPTRPVYAFSDGQETARAPIGAACDPRVGNHGGPNGREWHVYAIPFGADETSRKLCAEPVQRIRAAHDLAPMTDAELATQCQRYGVVLCELQP